MRFFICHLYTFAIHGYPMCGAIQKYDQIAGKSARPGRFCSRKMVIVNYFI